MRDWLKSFVQPALLVIFKLGKNPQKIRTLLILSLGRGVGWVIS